MKLATILLAFAFALPAFTSTEKNPLIIHEWGTFTSLQSETGRAIGSINIDDEPLPAFVHRIGDLILNDFTIYSKGAPQSLPEVTMRLETPVIYFHLPTGNFEP